MKHHFLLLRHCVRSVDPELDWGTSAANLPANIRAYLGIDLPNWQVGDMDCTAVGNEMVQRTGAWLVNSGTISPTAKIRWEIVADAEHRDVDTAYFLSAGIQQGLDKTYGKDGIVSVGEQDVHIDTQFSDPDFCLPTEEDPDWAVQVRSRIANLPRPALSFAEGLNLVQTVAGFGNMGNLVDALDLEPELDEDNWEISGAAHFLERMGSMLFMAKAADIMFAPQASTEQVFQLVQFHYWYRAVVDAGTSWTATYGGIQLQALIHVLRHGFYQKPLVRMNGSKDDYDTTVTIILGHDGDLDCMATALDAGWILHEPYLSGQDGTLIPTPPMAGIHAVRDTTTDQVDLSLVYPMYARSTAPTAHFYLNQTGILESAPLLFQRNVPYAQVQESATVIKAPAHLKRSSVDILEDHVLQVLDGYSPRSVECYHKAVDHWKTHEAIPDVKSHQASFPNDSNNSTVLLPVSLFCMGSLCGLLIMFVWMRRKHHYLISQDASCIVEPQKGGTQPDTLDKEELSETESSFFT